MADRKSRLPLKQTGGPTCRKSASSALIVAVAALSLLGSATDYSARGGAADEKAEAKRYVTDMAGRRVALPRHVKRIVTMGAVPVLNGFIFAFGDGDKIVNGLGRFARSPVHTYQAILAPSLAGKPPLQGTGSDPHVEELLKAAPDVIFTMDRRTVETLEKLNFPVIYLCWRQSGDVKRLMRLVGEVLGKEDRAAQYTKYFDETITRVRNVVGRVSSEKRPRVLYCSVRSLTQQHLIAEWWIETAGGVSVTSTGRTFEAFTFSLEQMLAWNPDILLVASPEDVKLLYEDRRFGVLAAVKTRKVFVAPVGAHLWANRTVELPLTVLWAAKIFYPEQFKNLNLPKEVQVFYSRFFHYPMSVQQAGDMLNRKW